MVKFLLWVREGHSKFHTSAGSKCPYCQQKLPDDFESNLALHFDKEYERKKSKLDSLCYEYRNFKEKLFRNVDLNIMQSKQISASLFSTYSDKAGLLKAAIEKNLSIIESKVKEPGTAVQLEPLTPFIDEVNSVVSAINTDIEAHNKAIENAQSLKDSLTI